MGIFDAEQTLDTSLPTVPWLETPLGFFDAPQLIQCRVCGLLKQATTRNFRNILTIDRFRTTCKPCEYKTYKGRRMNTRMNVIRLDPALPEPIKQALIEELPNVVRESRSARMKDARSREHTRAFNAQWRKVASIISYKRQMLAHTIQASRRINGALAQLMMSSAVVSNYVDAVLGTYSLVNDRLRNVEEWHATVDGHLPPEHWQQLILQLVLHKPNSAGYDNAVKPLCAFEFTTPDEQAMLKRLNPELALNPREEFAVRWGKLIDRQGHALMHQLYPWVAHPGWDDVRNITPDWLRAFNGLEKQG